MRSKGLAIIGLLVAASMVLAACGTATPETVIQTVIVEGTPQVVEVTVAAPPGPKVVHLNLGPGDVPTLDPSKSTDTSSVQIVESTTVGLRRQNEVTMQSEPGMATSWDISADGMTYTLHLRNDVPWVKWDGTQVVKVQTCPDANGATTDRMVTAHDFEYGIKRTLDPNTASDYAYVLAFALKGATEYNSSGDNTPEEQAKLRDEVAAKAVDDATLEVTFNEPAAYNISIIGMWVAHAEPAWLIDGDDCTTARGDKWTETGFFQGYGPFAMKEWVHDSEITLVKNPFWPGTDSVPVPKIDEVTLAMLDDVPAFAEYEAGNLDSAAAPLADMDRIKADPTLSAELHVLPDMCTYYYGFNNKAPFVDDQRVRLALSEAIDRQSLIDNVTKGGQEPAQWFARPGLAAAPTMADYPDLGVKYDPVDAKKLIDEYLAEKGITAADVDITLMFNTSSGHQKIAEAIQQMWKTNLGLDVKVSNQEWKVFLKTIRDPVATPQIYRLGWCQDYPDANNFDREVIAVGGSANPTGGGGINWDNDLYKQYKDLVDQAAVETDAAKRTALYAQAEEILVKTQAAIAPIYWYTRNTLTKPYLQRTYAASAGNERYEKWDITK
jgi:oligopeptide transport system substrate-binding protein